MRRVLLVVAAVLLGCAAAGTALTTAQVNRPPPEVREIFRLIDQATEKVERDRACRSPPPPTTTFTDDPPSNRFLATLGVLRRPQSAADRLPDEALEGLPMEGIYRGYVRVARSASGPDFLVVPARDIDTSKPRPTRCTAELRRRVGRLIRTKPARFKRRARRILRRVIRFGFSRPERKPVEGLYLFERFKDGLPASGGSTSVRELRRRGYVSSVGGRSAAPSTVHGLVPDGVASLTAFYPRVARRIGDGKPRRYASSVKRSSPVRDNVFSFVVPRRFEDSFPPKIVWRTAGGRVIKVIRPRG